MGNEGAIKTTETHLSFTIAKISKNQWIHKIGYEISIIAIEIKYPFASHMHAMWLFH